MIKKEKKIKKSPKPLWIWTCNSRETHFLHASLALYHIPGKKCYCQCFLQITWCELYIYSKAFKRTKVFSSSKKQCSCRRPSLYRPYCSQHTVHWRKKWGRLWGGWKNENGEWKLIFATTFASAKFRKNKFIRDVTCVETFWIKKNKANTYTIYYLGNMFGSTSKERFLDFLFR